MDRNPIPITSLDDPRVAVYRNLKEKELDRGRRVGLVDAKKGGSKIVVEKGQIVKVDIFGNDTMTIVDIMVGEAGGKKKSKV